MSTSWQRVRALFETVCDLEPADRAARLEKIGEEDPHLRAEVESLLAAGQQASCFLESPAVECFPLPEPESMVGRRIGSYQLIEEIATGGMGSVYLARRADEQYEKRVAIKLIAARPWAPGNLYPLFLARFRAERQTLANLEHPNIARLLDGGVTDDGYPYLVMEYVEGKPLDVYCDEHRLTTVQRLELFRSVCLAVHYAHRNLIVHRDLKPGNILVSSDGDVKLVDFGIAKMLQPSDRADTTATLAPHRLMTPQYASPEQIRGQTVTTASDVYSLGVVLYELLTGHRPYRFTSRVLFEMERTICETDPVKPSSIVLETEEVKSPDGATRRIVTPQAVSSRRDVHPQKLHRSLCGDLDGIILMALRAEPNRRYASVEQLSDDILRHLNGWPVRAHRDTLGYRTAKFVRRHRTAVVAAAMVAASILVGMGSTIWQSRIAQEQRDRAFHAQQVSQNEAAKAKQVSLFLQDMLASVDPRRAHGQDVTVREILDEASRRAGAELSSFPDVEAAIRTVIGNAYHSLGLYDQALPPLRAALQLRRKVHGNDSPDVAESLDNLGALLTSMGNYSEAEPLLREGLATRRKVLGETDLSVATSLSNLGKLVHLKGDLTEAETLRREALAIRRDRLGDDHPDVASSLTNLATVLHAQGKYDEALPLYRKALAIYRKTEGDEHSDVSDVLNNLAGLLMHKGRYDDAEAMYRESLAIRRKLLGRDHPNIARSLSNLAGLLAARGDTLQARSLHREALAIRRKRLDSRHPDVAISLNKLAETYSAVGEDNEAVTLLREAVDIASASLPPDHLYTARFRRNYGECLTRLQRYHEAETQLLASYDVFSRKGPPGDQRGSKVVADLIDLYLAWSKPHQAAKWRAKQGALFNGTHKTEPRP